MKRQSLNAWIICPRKRREKINSQGLNTGQPDSTLMCFLLFHSNTQETDPRQLRQNESKIQKKKKKSLWGGSTRFWHGQKWFQGWTVSLHTMVNRIMPPKGVHVLIPRTCEYITYLGKRISHMWIKLRNLRWGHDPGLSWRTLWNQMGPVLVSCGYWNKRQPTPVFLLGES